MKVIHVITDTNFGGAGRYLTYLLSQPAFEGIDVAVACPDGELGKRLDAMGIRRIAISGRDVSYNTRLTRELYALFRRERPDVVHTHSSLSGRIAARLRRIPVVYTKHGEAGASVATGVPADPASPTRVRGRAVNPLKRFVNKTVAAVLSDKIIAVSGRVSEELAQSGIDPSKIVTIPNGIELGPYSMRPRTRRSGFLVGALARLSREKGLDVLLHAAKLVLASEPSARFMIGGTGPLEEELRRKIRELKLEPYVRMAGFIEDVPSFLSELDVFVLPSDSEGIGLAIMEAMATGLPVVATAVGGVPEVVSDGQTGILVPPRQPKLLAQAIVRLLVDPDLARAMGAAGRNRVEALFDAKVMAERTVAVYRSLVRSSR